MNRNLIVALAVLASYPLITAAGGGAGCATTREPRVETVVVKEPVPMPCPDRRAPPPDWIDREDSVIAAVERGEFDKAFALLWGGRGQRIQYQAESDAQIAACARPSPD